MGQAAGGRSGRKVIGMKFSSFSSKKRDMPSAMCDILNSALKQQLKIIQRESREGAPLCAVTPDPQNEERETETQIHRGTAT